MVLRLTPHAGGRVPHTPRVCAFPALTARDSCSQAARRAIHEGVVSAETPAALLLDGQKLVSQASAVQSAFSGAHFNHAFAVKSNPTLVR